MLMHEFDSQTEVTLEMLVKDELPDIMGDFNEKDKSTFDEITHYHSSHVLLEVDHITHMREIN